VFRLELNNPCFLCNSPTEINMIFSHLCKDNFLDLFNMWVGYRFLNTVWNQKIYKKFGSIVRPVCAGCYYYSIKNMKHFLKHREYTGEKLNKQISSKSYKEIYEWFERFNNFRNQPYINDTNFFGCFKRKNY